MNDITPAPVPEGSGKPRVSEEEYGQITRDRVLLYVRGMDISPLHSLALAAESLARAGENSSPAEAMRALRQLLKEEKEPAGQLCGLEDNGTLRMQSCPPMNRHPMIVEDLDRTPWLSALRRLLNMDVDPLQHRGGPHV